MLLVLFVVLCVARAQEPEPMSFDEFQFVDDDVSGEYREFAADKRLESMSFLKELLSQGAHTGPRRAELVLRLAHLYHEHGRAEHDVELIGRAADLYRVLLQNHRDSVAVDHVTFFLGFALQSVHDADGDPILDRVVREFPTSSYVPHAYLHLGESAFADPNYAAAEAYYRAAASRDFEFREFAWYKLAFALRRLDRTPEAITAMRTLVTVANPDPLELRAREAIAFWSDELGADPALPEVTVQRFAPVDCTAELPALWQQRADQPLAPSAPTTQLRVVRCLASVGRRGEARAEAQKLSAEYGRGSRWWSAQDRSGRNAVKATIASAWALSQ